MKYWKLMILGVIIICVSSQMLYGQYKEFMYDGIMREYAVSEPSLGPNPDGYPLVIGLHGAGADGYTMIGTAFTGNNEVREIKRSCIVASPNALVYNLISWWNAGDGYEEMVAKTMWDRRHRCGLGPRRILPRFLRVGYRKHLPYRYCAVRGYRDPLERHRILRTREWICSCSHDHGWS